MKEKNVIKALLLAIPASMLLSCGGGGQTEETTMDSTMVDSTEMAIQNEVAQPTVIQAVTESLDHTTLLSLLKATEFADTLANAGPFTLFAPANDAFTKLPKGTTIERLLKPEGSVTLHNILANHIASGVFALPDLQDGQKISTNLGDVVIGKNGDKYTVNGANIVSTITASNGIVYVIDSVLTPAPSK